MTWTRLTDTWVDDPVFYPLDLAARWHYLAMVQWCSRNKQYDGVMRLGDARRASDVDDPTKAIGDLIVADLVENVDGATIRLVRIDDHVPPPSMRNAAEKTKVRMRRYRKHKTGDHSDCLPDNCPDASRDASPRDGTGQAGTGTAPHTVTSDVTNEEMWAEYQATWGDAE